MTPDRDHLERIRALAKKAGLVVRERDLDAFIASYRPALCNGLTLSPSYLWLCELCEPKQLERIWMLSPRENDLGSFAKENADLAANGYEYQANQPLPWPKELLAFGNTGDEYFCFAYSTPDTEPAVVIVDHYGRAVDEEDNEYVDWQWYTASFEEWLAIQADWLLESDAKMRQWKADR